MKLSNRTELHDDDLMPFGKWKGKRLGEVPDHYWKWFIQQEEWFIQQEWASEHPSLLAYGKLAEDE